MERDRNAMKGLAYVYTYKDKLINLLKKIYNNKNKNLTVGEKRLVPKNMPIKSKIKHTMPNTRAAIQV